MASATSDRVTDDQRLGAAIRQRREALGVSQSGLAASVGLPAAQSVSTIENGTRTVKASELVRIARALHVEPAALLGDVAGIAPRVLWRRGSTDKNLVLEARLLERSTRYAQLERWCNYRPATKLPDLDFDPAVENEKSVQHLAEHTRCALDLGPVPARTLRTRLENDFGVKVFFESLSTGEKGNGSAACVRHPSFGAAILMAAGEAEWRQSFSFAHELFHLVTWTSVSRAWDACVSAGESEPRWYKKLESLADSFAAALLMPTEALTSRFDAKVVDGKIALADLAGLAVEFGVSHQALVIRLAGLHRFSKGSKEDLLGSVALKEYVRTLRPMTTTANTGSLPERFEQLARTAFMRREVGKSLLARYLEKNVADLADFQLGPLDGNEAAAALT